MENEQTQARSQANGETLKSKASELTQEAKQRGRKQLRRKKSLASSSKPPQSSDATTNNRSRVTPGTLRTASRHWPTT
jgi:hypothetical protein